MNLSLSQEWKQAKLGQVAKIERKSVQPTDILAGTTYVGLEHIDGEGMFNSVQSVNAGDIASNKFAFDCRHLLYGKLRPYLKKIARPNFSGVCSTDILPILPGKHIDKDFLHYYLRQPKYIELATNRSTGVNLPRLSPKILEEFPIYFPPLKEQKRIAAILDKADAIRRKRKEAIRLIEELLRSTFLDMFGDPVTNPKGWKTIKFGKIIISGIQNGLYKPASDYGSGTPIIRIDSFYEGNFKNISKFKRVRIDSTLESIYKVNQDEILINRVNSPKYLGKSALVPKLEEPTIFESNMMRLAIDTEKADPRFIVTQLHDPWVKGQVSKKRRDAVNQSSINQTDVKSLELRLPTLEKQRQFTRFYQKIQHLIRTEEKKLTWENNLFNSLLQKAFRGEL